MNRSLSEINDDTFVDNPPFYHSDTVIRGARETGVRVSVAVYDRGDFADILLTDVVDDESVWFFADAEKLTALSGLFATVANAIERRNKANAAN